MRFYELAGELATRLIAGEGLIGEEVTGGDCANGCEWNGGLDKNVRLVEVVKHEPTRGDSGQRFRFDFCCEPYGCDCLSELSL